MTVQQLLIAAVLLAAGYVTGRTRPGPRILRWAEDQVALRPRWSLRLWIAVPVALAALAALWILHPCRTRANRRSWREAEQRRAVDVPRFDAGWAARR